MLRQHKFNQIAILLQCKISYMWYCVNREQQVILVRNQPLGGLEYSSTRVGVVTLDTSGQVVTLLRNSCQSNFSCVNTALCKHLRIVRNSRSVRSNCLSSFSAVLITKIPFAHWKLNNALLHSYCLSKNIHNVLASMMVLILVKIFNIINVQVIKLQGKTWLQDIFSEIS